jgi:RNA polymerase-binding transcription factor DksA
MAHPFLNDQEISQIIGNLENKKQKLKQNLPDLIEIAKPTERENVSSDDSGLYESSLFEKSMANDAIKRTRENIQKCEEILLQLKRCPETYGFDKRTGASLPVEVLLCNPLCNELPAQYYVATVPKI